MSSNLNVGNFFGFGPDPVPGLIKSGNQFKLTKRWSDAGDAFVKAAEHLAKRGDRHLYERADCYETAADCYCYVHKLKAVECMEHAATLYCEVGQFSIAARLFETAGELTEQMGRESAVSSATTDSDTQLTIDDLCFMQQALKLYQKAADYFNGEQSVASAASCQTKAAILLGDISRFHEAAKEFEKIGVMAQGHDQLEFEAKDHIFKSCLCLAMELEACSESADRLSKICPSFAGSEEFTLIKKMTGATTLAAFDAAVAEFEKVKKLKEFDKRRIKDARAFLMMSI